MAAPEVSVVVPTRDRPADLARCMEAVARQTGISSLEIVVVDDGSIDAGGVASIVGRYPSARLVRLEGRGPAAARNAGVAAASAPVICFTDDDCEPRPDWANRLTDALAAGAAAAGGRTGNVNPGSPFAAASTIVALSLLDPTPGVHPYTAFSSTANLAVRRDVMTAVPFDESYRFASEDRDWCTRLTTAGYRLVRASEAIVLHHRDDRLLAFLRRYLRYGEGSYRFRQVHSSGRPGPAGLYRGVVREGFRKGPAVGLLVVVSQLATAVGFGLAAVAARRR